MTSSNRKAFACVLAAFAMCAGAFLEACSASPGGSMTSGGYGSSGDTGGGAASDAGAHPASQCPSGPTTVSKAPGVCANPTVPLVFSPMYSAYIPGATLRSFSIPAVTGDGCPATWSLSDPAQAILHAESFVAGAVTTPGVMITMAAGGGSAAAAASREVTVVATKSDGSCGSSVLTITQNTQDDWTIGDARYNHGVSLHLPPAGSGAGAADGGFVTSSGGSFLEADAGTPCSSCHSQTVKTGQYTDVAHTPEQAGGFSDSDMRGIILHGEVPDGGYFDPAVINSACTGAGTTLSPSMSACGLAAYAQFQGFHQWSDIAADQLPGMICYLRSLTPEGQSGTSNFGH
jgi:hypothetical protein